ncbi:GAS2-like protein 1 [Clonorchis sinensis]|uniref:GAS2-like protein 1 n=1 Tax=Clonorchis sinensis TaxID=79923 RepID=G7Y4Q4_CLOSI|nr:GAS2-like protein 1 [Clonorchis sinensis]
MSIATQNGGRCSSLPPSTFNNEDCLAVLDLSAESMVPRRIPSSILQHNSKERHKNSKLEPSDVAQGPTYFSSCNVFQSYPTSEDSQVHQSTRVSPSGSSLVTDEDSGYGRIAHPAFGQTGSSSSIANSGLSVADNISSSDSAPRDELLIVMTEDLVDWFQRMYPRLSEHFDVDNFFEKLSDGVLLCRYANDLHHLLTGHCSKTRKEGRLQLNGTRIGGVQAYLPAGCPVYQTRGLQGSSATCGFVSRDNVSNFLTWCRQLGMLDSVLFESEDLVCRKNPRNVAICLLELARLGGRFGMAIPELIQLEVEIDEELATESHDSRSLTQRSSEISSSSSSITEHDRIVYCRRASCGVDKHVAESKLQEPVLGSSFCCSTGDERGDGPRDRAYKSNRSSELRKLKKQQDYSVRKHTSNVKETVVSGKRKPELNRPIVDMRSLDEIVRDLLSQCTCPQTFPMIRVSEGRYLFGDKCTQIFVRILRNHVMVRVGGGWDTLNHFLTKYDECRKANPPNYRFPSESVFPSKMRQAKVNPSDADQVLASIRPCNTTPPSKEGSPIKGQGILCAIKKSPSRELPNGQRCDDLESHKKYNGDTVIPVGKAVSTESYQNGTCNLDQPEAYSTPNLTLVDTSEPKVFPELVSTQQTTADNVPNNIFNGLCKPSCTATEQLEMTQLPSSDSRNGANDTERNSSVPLMKSTSRKTNCNNVFDRLSNSTQRKPSLGQLLNQDGSKASRPIEALFKASKPKQSRSTKPMPLIRVDRKLQQQQCAKAESTERAHPTRPLSSGRGSRFQDASTPLFVDADPPHKIGAKHRLSSRGMNEQTVNSRRPSAPQSLTSPVSPVGLSTFDCSDSGFSRIPRPIRSYSLSRIPLSTTSIARLNLTTVHDI